MDVSWYCFIHSQNLIWTWRWKKSCNKLFSVQVFMKPHPNMFVICFSFEDFSDIQKVGFAGELCTWMFCFSLIGRTSYLKILGLNPSIWWWNPWILIADLQKECPFANLVLRQDLRLVSLILNPFFGGLFLFLCRHLRNPGNSARRESGWLLHFPPKVGE